MNKREISSNLEELIGDFYSDRNEFESNLRKKINVLNKNYLSLSKVFNNNLKKIPYLFPFPIISSFTNNIIDDGLSIALIFGFSIYSGTKGKKDYNEFFEFDKIQKNKIKVEHASISKKYEIIYHKLENSLFNGMNIKNFETQYNPIDYYLTPSLIQFLPKDIKKYKNNLGGN